jgi:enoyl-CoA hydratase/carnithine racemase
VPEPVGEYETLRYDETDDGVAWVTLARPDVHNAFDDVMCRELAGLWRSRRDHDGVRAIVLTGAGDKAFCTGIDRSGVPASEDEFTFDPFTYDDPGVSLGPKANDLWKPVIAAVNGMACGGAFYLLGEVEFLVAAEHATFFDPHVTYGMPAVFEPILMAQRMPFGEIMRLSLMGNHERLSAQRALEIGLVSEVVPAAELRAVTHAIAADLGRGAALGLGNALLGLAMNAEDLEAGQRTFASGARTEWRVR